MWVWSLIFRAFLYREVLVHHHGFLADWNEMAPELRRSLGFGSEPLLPAMSAVLASASGDRASVTCRMVVISPGKFRKVEKEMGVSCFVLKHMLVLQVSPPFFPIQKLIIRLL